MENTSVERPKVRLSGTSMVFDVPEEAGAALGAIVENGLETYGRLMLPDIQDLIPSDAKIDKEWDGICEWVAERWEQFRLQSEELSRQVVAKVKDTLGRKRTLEQSSGKILVSDLFVRVLGGLGTEPLSEAKRQQRIVAMLADLRAAEEKLRKAARSSIVGRGRRVEARRLELEKTYSKAVSAVRRFVVDQCQRIASTYVRAEIEEQLRQMEECTAWLRGECHEERLRERRISLEQDPAWLGQSAAGHRASMAPKGWVLEKALRRISPYAGAASMELVALWRAFGAWCSARGTIATATGPQQFGQRLGTFIHEISSNLFSSVTLGQIYVSARESLPIEELRTACKPPFPLADSQEVRAASGNAVRIVEVPDEIREDTVTRLGSRWIPRRSDNPNSLVLVECYDGISARSIILNGNPDWEDALTKSVLERHAASPKSLDAMLKAGPVKDLTDNSLIRETD